MKKVTAFIGTARRKTTYEVIQEFEKILKKYGEIDFEYVFLNDYNLEFCNGCKLCFDKGEENCRISDDSKLLLEKMENSDGIIFASPNYSFQVSARMKNYIERFSYMFHRPRFFGKTFMPIVTQGVMGGNKIVKYLENTGMNFGFDVVKGSLVNTLEPMTEKQQEKIRISMEKAAARFNKKLMNTELEKPSIFRLMIFRMTRTNLKNAKVRLYDYYYFKEKGWFDSEYYYNVNLGFSRKFLGKIFDIIGYQMAKNMMQ